MNNRVKRASLSLTPFGWDLFCFAYIASVWHKDKLPRSWFDRVEITYSEDRCVHERWNVHLLILAAKNTIVLEFCNHASCSLQRCEIRLSISTKQRHICGVRVYPAGRWSAQRGYQHTFPCDTHSYVVLKSRHPLYSSIDLPFHGFVVGQPASQHSERIVVLA